MRWKTVTHFCWFLKVLEYFPIGVKFPPITATLKFSAQLEQLLPLGVKGLRLHNAALEGLFLIFYIQFNTATP
jgi:hypothetical protein